VSNFNWNYPPGVTGNEPEIAGVTHDARCPQHDDRSTVCRAENCGRVLAWPLLGDSLLELPSNLPRFCQECMAAGWWDEDDLPMLVLPEAAPCRCDDLADGDREHAALERWERQREEGP